jgi:hypothetical protein
MPRFYQYHFFFYVAPLSSDCLRIPHSHPQATFGGKDLTLQLTLEPEDIAPIFDGAAW